MKLEDLIKKGSLTEQGQKCSKSSNCSRSNTLESSPSVASTLINKINKNSNCSKCSYTYALRGKEKTGTYKPGATATSAIPATERPMPYLDRDGALVIPFGCDPKYRWWQGGQFPSETEKEVRTWLH